MKWVERTALTGLAVLVLAACGPDLGLEGNIPLEVARSQPPKPLVEQTLRISPAFAEAIPEAPVHVASQYWLASATEYRLPVNFVQSVGTVDGFRFYAFAWDEPPFDRLLLPWEGPPYQAGNYWLEFLELR